MSVATLAVKGVAPQLKLEDGFEKLSYMDDYSWTMFDGEQFTSKVFYKDERLFKEDLTDVICHYNATVYWQDAHGMHHCNLKAPEINIYYIINSILFYYKRQNMTPGKVCMLESVNFDPFHHSIYLEFGS